jgi:hypothetical protein
MILGERRVSIEEARMLEGNPLVWWRPEPNLPEDKQYALVAEE